MDDFWNYEVKFVYHGKVKNKTHLRLSSELENLRENLLNLHFLVFLVTDQT